MLHPLLPRFQRPLLLAPVLLGLALAPSLQAGIFLKFAPEQLKGAAKEEGYEGWFEADGDLSWSVNGTERNTTQATPGFFDIRIPLSHAHLQAELLRRLVTPPTEPQDVSVHLLQQSQDAKFAFFRLKLLKASMVSMDFDTGDGQPPFVNARLEYKGLQVEYHYQDSKKPKVLGELTEPGGNNLMAAGSGGPLDPVVTYVDFTLQQVQVSGISGAVTNEPPTLSSIPTQTWPENVTREVYIFANSPRVSETGLVVTALASNPLLLPDDQLEVVPIGSNTFRLVMTPVRNTSGESLVRVRVEDGFSYAESQFKAVVQDGPKTPVIAPILQARRMAWNTSASVSFAIADPDTAVTNLNLQVTSDNATLFPPGSLIVSETSPNDRNLTMIPATGHAGVVRITISLSDGVFTPSQTFVVAVDAVTPDSPTNITLPIDILDNLKENLPDGTVLNPAPLSPLLASDPTPGDSHLFVMLSDADGRFDIADGNRLRVARGGSALNVEKAQYHTVLIRAFDNASNHYSRVFTLPLLNVNDSPSFRYFPSPWFGEIDTPTPLPTLVVTDEDAGFVYPVRLTLVATGGTLLVDTVLLGPGVTVTGNGSANVVVEGLMERITDLLFTSGGVLFTPNAGYSGDISVTLTVNDQNGPNTTAIGEFPNYFPAEASLTLPGFIMPSAFATWSRTEHGNDTFDPTLQTNVWGSTTDKDGDGFVNLLEYGLGYKNSEINTGNPLEPSVATGLGASLPADNPFFLLAGDSPVNPTYNLISFVVREDPRLLAWVEAADGLLPFPVWSSDVSEIELYQRQSLGNGFERMIFRDPDPYKPYRVYRLGMAYTNPFVAP